MLYILVWFGSLKQISCQFAPHMDLQKIDEIMFDNAKYTVLKPTVHITRDHFKDFIQKRDNKDFPGEKVYVDRNGFRHYWAGFRARKPKSLRKAILESSDIPYNKVKNLTSKTAEVSHEGTYNTTAETNMTKKVKNKPMRKKKISEPDNVFVINKTNDKLALRDDDGKTKVKTTFFCPFFGVVTMMSYID